MEKKVKQDGFKIAVVSLLAVNLLIWVWALVLDLWWNKSVRDMEIRKVWWIENFKLLEKYYESDDYKKWQKTALENALSVLNKWNTQNQENPNNKVEEKNDTVVQNSEEMKKKFSEIIKDAYVKWDKKARFTILEYSEFLCPYCKRQKVQGVLESVMEKYPKDVNVAFRHFIVHEQATEYALGSECVYQQKWVDGFYEFIKLAFAETALNSDFVSKVSESMWLDSSDFDYCMSSEKTMERVSSQTSEWRSLFGVSGTPGNVILDTKTGKFVLVPGAYPAEKFIEEIEKLMK